MRRVYVAESLVDARLVVDLLFQHGIDAKLFNENGAGALGELPVTCPEVWICEDRESDLARILIKEFCDRPEQDASRTCRTCGDTSPASFDFCWQCHASLTEQDNL